MDLLEAPAPKLRGFEAIARAIMSRGRGVTLDELRSVGALSRELEKEAPDPKRVRWLARDLGLDPDDLEGK